MEILKVAGLYAAGVIGAGFASGQELVQFFSRYGLVGLFGVGLSTLALTLGCGYILEYCHQKKVDSYGTLIESISARIGHLVDLVYTGFLLVGTGVMLAGAGELFSTLGSSLTGSYVTALLLVLVLLGGTERVLKLSTSLTPILLGVLFCTSARYLIVHGITIPIEIKAEGVGASILYASYNLAFSLAVLAGVHQLLNTRIQRWQMAVLGNLPLGLVMLLLVLTLWSLPPNQQRDAIPLLHAAADWSIATFRLYRIALWGSMYTTALANSFALAQRLSTQMNLNWSVAAVTVVGAAAASSHLGFIFLIRLMYPLLGMAGLYLLILMWKSLQKQS